MRWQSKFFHQSASGAEATYLKLKHILVCIICERQKTGDTSYIDLIISNPEPLFDQVDPAVVPTAMKYLI
jgi:hypothetical protein